MTSVGRIACALLTGKEPFAELQGQIAIGIAIKEGKRPTRPPAFEIEQAVLSELMASTENAEPSMRPNAPEFLGRLIAIEKSAVA